MLSYSLLRNHAGILLAGDYTSLTWLHEVVHDVNERSPLVIDKEGSFLGLAYDVRKALEQQREVIQPPRHSREIGVRYGVKILWPVLMLQQRLLRQSLAFLSHTAKRNPLPTPWKPSSKMRCARILVHRLSASLVSGCVLIQPSPKYST